MKFIRLNGMKVLAIFWLCIAIFSFFALLCYLAMSRNLGKSELTESMPYMLMVVYGIGLAVFMLLFFGGMHQFYRARKKLSYVLTLDFFDKGEVRNGYLDSKSWFYYTKECLIGTVERYPAVISLDQGFSKYTPSRFIITFYLIKNNKVDRWNIFIPLNWRGEPSSDIKADAEKTISTVEGKGYTHGELLQGLQMDGVVLGSVPE